MTKKSRLQIIPFLFVSVLLLARTVDTTAADLTNELVCHLTFDNDLQDHSHSVHRNHGTPVGDPTYEAGRIGHAIVLRGSRGQYVDLGQPKDLQFGDRESGTDFSVSLWVRIDASETWPVFITNKDYSSKPAGNSTSHTGWGIFLHTDKKLRWNCKDDKNDALFVEHAGPMLANAAWHHITVTVDRQGRAVTYVDGHSIGSIYMGTLASTIDAGLPTVIGNDGIHGMAAWDGAVDDLGIWRRTLTPHEVWSVYAGGLEGASLCKVEPVATLLNSDLACRWIPGESEPTLSVKVTNNGSAPLTPNGWRVAGPQADAFTLKSAPAKTLAPGESIESRVVWDRTKTAGTNIDAALLFDHGAANRESAFSVDLARQIRRAPYRYRLDGFEKRMGRPVPQDEQGRIVVNDGYHDPAMVEGLLKAFAEKYPATTKLERIGATWQERGIWALKISADAKAESDKPAFLFVGAHHGSELLSTEFVLDIVQQLTANPNADPRVREWLDQYEIWCLPLANPDGCHRFFHVASAGRKNGRDNNANGMNDFLDGVDLNRNYPFRWHSLGEEGSKSDPNTSWYRGPEPASEPEVQAIMEFANRERFVALISYHTAGTKILVPYTIDDCRSPRPNTAWVLAGHLAALSDSGRDDRDYLPVRNLYSVDGTDQDWHFWKHGTLAYIWEGPRTNPTYADRDRYVAGVRPGWQFLLDRLAAGPALSGHVRDEEGRSLEAVVTLDQIETFEGEAHTSHPVTGRFDRILPQAGTYHLNVSKRGYMPKSVKIEVGREWKRAEVELRAER
jgi:zinc carboxypeptidase/concanavalin A-like lectin/glucanase superfamily protein